MSIEDSDRALGDASVFQEHKVFFGKNVSSHVTLYTELRGGGLNLERRKKESRRRNSSGT